MNPTGAAAIKRRAVGRGRRGPAPRRPAWGRAAAGRAVFAAVVTIALLGALTVTAGVAHTSAAWVDRTYAAAPVSAGAWSAFGSCTAMTAQNTPVGTCTIASMTYDGSGAANKHLRTYTITFQVSAPSSIATVSLSADLSTATRNSDTSIGPWNWANAMTLPSTQFSPTSACAALPAVTGRTAAGLAWSNTTAISFTLADSTAAFSGRPSCS